MPLIHPYKVPNLVGVGPANFGTFGGNTILLAQCEGANGATTMNDSIASVTWAFTGTAALSTAQASSGSSSLNIAAGTDEAKSSDIDVGDRLSASVANSWTFEFFVRVATNVVGSMRAVIRDQLDGDPCVQVDTDINSIAVTIQDPNAQLLVNSTLTPTLNVDTWYHIAVVRNVVLGTYDTYFNGNRLENVSETRNMNSTGPLKLTSTVSQTGFFDSVRVSNIARYSGTTYTVPTASFNVD